MKKALHAVNAWIPWVVIGSVFLWAALSIALRHKKAADEGGVTIRIAHWQLEPGVRDGIAEAAEAYHKMHPDVRIVQEAIPESTYGQWMSTQLMGGTAPDILEAGMVDNLNAFFVRDFVPVTKYVSRPNPYNDGTPLQGQPLYKTYKDDMSHSFVPQLQQYMTIPLAMTSIRVFYNKTLLKKLTGLDSAPTEYRAFIAACEKIRQQKQPGGSPYIAIAGSPYYFTSLDTNMAQPLTYNALRKMDFNRDGETDANEQFMAFATGKISFNDPAFRGAFQMISELVKQMPNGWAGLSRDEALFNFAQQKAVFAPTGVWEAAGIQDLAKGNFDLGIIDFPVPTTSDPAYGPLFHGTRFEAPVGQMPMGISRASKNPDIAADFLLYLASLKENERFNQHLKWVPVIIGAQIDPLVKVFDPTLVGPSSAFNPAPYAETFTKWNQLYQLYQIGEISYDELAKQYTDFYMTRGYEDFKNMLLDRRRQQVGDQQTALGWRQDAMSSQGTDADRYWSYYRNVITGEQLQGDQFLADDGRVLTDPEALKNMSFYQFTPLALANIRKGLSASAAIKGQP